MAKKKRKVEHSTVDDEPLSPTSRRFVTSPLVDPNAYPEGDDGPKRKRRAKRKSTPAPASLPTSVRGLQSTSFKRATSKVPQRIIALVTGQTNTGRTHLTFTAPGPIAYQGIEMGDEGVKEQFADDKIIMGSHYIAQVVRKLDQTDANEKKKAQAEAGDIYHKFATDFVAALKSPDIKTIVWDTGSQLGELARVAAFGRLTKVLPRDWTDQKYEFSKLVQMAYAYDKNFLVIAKLGAVYRDDKRTGELEPKGMSDVLYLFPTIVRTYTEIEDDEPVYWYEVEKVKGADNGHLLGKIYDPPENKLEYLWADMFDREPEEWGNG